MAVSPARFGMQPCFGQRQKQITKDEQAREAAAHRQREERQAEQDSPADDGGAAGKALQKKGEEIKDKADGLIDKIDAALAENARELNVTA